MTTLAVRLIVRPSCRMSMPPPPWRCSPGATSYSGSGWWTGRSWPHGARESRGLSRPLRRRSDRASWEVEALLGARLQTERVGAWTVIHHPAFIPRWTILILPTRYLANPGSDKPFNPRAPGKDYRHAYPPWSTICTRPTLRAQPHPHVDRHGRQYEGDCTEHQAPARPGV